MEVLIEEAVSKVEEITLKVMGEVIEDIEKDTTVAVVAGLLGHTK